MTSTYNLVLDRSSVLCLEGNNIYFFRRNRYCSIRFYSIIEVLIIFLSFFPVPFYFPVLFSLLFK